MGNLELEILKGPPIGPRVEKERKGGRVHNPMKDVVGFFLRLPRLGPKGPHKFNEDGVIQG